MVTTSAVAVEPAGTVFYPYWDVEAWIRVEAPLLLPPVSRRWRIAVDGVSGELVVPPPLLEIEDAPGDPFLGDLQVVAFAVRAADLYRHDVRQALWQYASRRVRSWMNVRVELGEARPVYKELRLYKVTFRTGTTVLLALDTITGEYSVVPPHDVLYVTGQGERGERGP
ncbi:MAG: hypothetical protein QN173_08875 [Armatimonadota bacterium]|nr:hypothetical protein [Armatimonadota bacterium]MDR7438170.1 hypothetical protein [Armatimonadota bacterium]MDR7472200.1 hypothetical protein [Armatimonadota bacterium]MDR7507700.1 hypothetical protein [Armatimonadota bacterium]MDR7559680.1 hypothetical protein [Armatimonadota bacterium]